MKLLFNNLHKRLSVFKFFILSYLIIIAILALICTVTYSRLFNAIDEYENKNLNSLLNQTNKILTQYMDEIDNVPKQLITNRSICNFLSENLYTAENPDPYSINEIVNTLKSYKAVNLLLDDILLYSAYNEKLINSSTSFDGTIGYGPLLSLEELSFEEMKSTLLHEYSFNRLIPETAVKLNSEPSTDILHITSLNPYGTLVDGNAVLFINSEKLINLLEQNYGDLNVCIYFYDKEGTLLTKTANAPYLEYSPDYALEKLSLDGTEYLTCSTDNHNSWNIVVAVPYRASLKNLFNLKLVIIIAFTLSLLACLFLAFGFSKMNFRPIQQIMTHLGSETTRGKFAQNEFSAITAAVEKLMNSEQYLHEELERSLPTLRADFVQTLLQGGFSDSEIIEKSAKKLMLDISGEVFLVVLVCLENTDSAVNGSQAEQINIARKLIYESFCAKTNCLYTNYSTNGIALLLCLDQKDTDANLMMIESTINSISDVLYRSQKFHMMTALGTFCDTISDAFYSYEHAKDTLTTGIQSTLGSNTWCTPNFDGLSSWYYFPFEISNKLTESFLSGDLDDVNKILDNICNENLENRILSGSMISLLYHDVKITLCKLLDKATPQEPDAQLERLDFELPLKEFFTIAKQILAGAIQSKRDTSSDMRTAILNYVNTEALSQSFGRQAFAQHFYISEEYVSKFFKENTGYNFLKYVTKIKMDTAQRMLLEGNYTVDKIALAVGYNSSVSFRRAFKAYTGLTPSEFQRRNVN